jgi:hypothetical protein
MLELPSGNDSIWIGVILALIGLVLVSAGLWRAPISPTWKLRLALLYCAAVALAIFFSR